MPAHGTFSLARTTTENASLISCRLMSPTETPAILRARGTDLDGAVGKSFGSCAASAKPGIVVRSRGQTGLSGGARAGVPCPKTEDEHLPRMRASGFQPICAAFSGVVRMTADAPSFSLDELAAVTVPVTVRSPRTEKAD